MENREIIKKLLQICTPVKQSFYETITFISNYSVSYFLD